MDADTRDSLRTVIAYLWRDEEINWEEEGKPEDDHIFVHLKRLYEWYERSAYHH